MHWLVRITLVGVWVALASGCGSDGISIGTPAPSPGATLPVLFVAEQDARLRFDLFTTDPATPGRSIKLNHTMPMGVYQFAPVGKGDSAAVVYTSNTDTVDLRDLFLVDIARPGAAVPVNPRLLGNGIVLDFAVSPDRTKVVYRANVDTLEPVELYFADLARPGNAVKLNSAPGPGGWVHEGFSFSPDGTKVLYLADGPVAVELYLVDVATPTLTRKLNAPLVSGGNVLAATFSPDGSTVAYVADQDEDKVDELYAVPIVSSGSVARLNGPLAANGDVAADSVRFSPDSRQVAYYADEDTNNLVELYTVSLAQPGQSVKMNSSFEAGGGVTGSPAFTPDSHFILYTAKRGATSPTDLFRSDLTIAGIGVELNADLPDNGAVIAFRLNPAGTKVSYVANQDKAAIFELYQADLGTLGTPTKLSAPMNAAGVVDFDYSRDGAHIVYRAKQKDSLVELFQVDVASPTVSRKLSGALANGGGVWEYLIAP